MSTPSASLSNIEPSPGGFNQHTEGTVVQASNEGHHPLRSAGLSDGFGDTGITRPHLTRILDSERLVDVPSILDGQEDTDKDRPTEDEKVVIVHQVSPKDSLAGVSLKYRIKLTELRRANHLWASDSIHLRRVLYIPLEKTSLPPSSAIPSFSSSSAEPASPCSSKSPVPEDVKSPMTNTISSSAVRRVPVSELSFFPPPAKPSKSFSPSSPSHSQASHSRELYARHATSPTPSLNTILTALPIPASTRDTIIARLSLDSPSSSYSERDRESYLNGYEGHELADVPARRESTRHSFEDNRKGYLDGVSRKPSKNRQYLTSHIRAPSKRPGLNAVSSNVKVGGEPLGLGGHGRSFSEEYIGPPSASTRKVRNIQLEPSPVMQIPIRNHRDNDIPGQKKSGLPN
ncbi:hypothetical protein F5890DRAFT_1400892 [Lentinula detonsa]|uniref:LysM domain-containing protein n=1 Tax=Lentinula detonsa TaxID=2804962 RepID=A0AA38Q9M0_9AGAR|nr:hypothetical protein F5890DRAFT_1400892 [Lentinula detonsa]